MKTPSFQNDFDGFIWGLEGVPLKNLRGAGSEGLKDLEAFIASRGVVFTHNGRNVSADSLKRVLACFLPADAKLDGGFYDSQIDQGIKFVKRFLAEYLGANPGQSLELKDFVEAAYAGLVSDRIDGKVISAYINIIEFQDGSRIELRDDLRALTAELKVFSAIQSKINGSLTTSKHIDISNGDVNLLDMKLYGFVDVEKWKDSPEYKLLSHLDSYKGAGVLSIKDFLVGNPKESVAMSSDRIKNAYKDDEISQLATMVGDCARPINDRVSEKTTHLNGVSSRYNAAIEALSRFVQKFDNTMRDILRAI